MKKLSPKSVKIIGILIIIILMAILIYEIIDLVKNNKKNKATQTISMKEEMSKENIQTNNDTEVEIVYLNNLVVNKINIEEKESETSLDSSNTDSSNTAKPNTDNKSKYYIKVNCGANVVTIYTKDSEGNYTVPYKAMVCSTGTATPRYLGGRYEIKGRWEWGALFGGVYGHYCVHIVDQILFHSVPYMSKSSDSLKYWEYDKLRDFSFGRMHKIDS